MLALDYHLTEALEQISGKLHHDALRDGMCRISRADAVQHIIRARERVTPDLTNSRWLAPTDRRGEWTSPMLELPERRVPHPRPRVHPFNASQRSLGDRMAPAVPGDWPRHAPPIPPDRGADAMLTFRSGFALRSDRGWGTDPQGRAAPHRGHP